MPGFQKTAAGSTASGVCRGSKARLPLEPGRSSRCGLFARRAGIHVDFHAHRHFDNLRRFPGHSSLPRIKMARQSRAPKSKASSGGTQGFTATCNVVRCPIGDNYLDNRGMKLKRARFIHLALPHFPARSGQPCSCRAQTGAGTLSLHARHRSGIQGRCIGDTP